MEEQKSQNRNEQITIENIERKIKNGQYKDKEELTNYLIELRQRGLITIDNGKIMELLNLFDEFNQSLNSNLDMSNYKSATLQNTDVIFAKEENKMLLTQEGTSSIIDEFKKNQNEIITNNNDKNVTADQVFEKMTNQQKEELELLSLSEAIIHSNISKEILNKIKFFIENSKMNPHIFKVNLRTGIFYNIEEKEAYEVKINEETNEYEIYRGSEKTYAETSLIEEKDEELIEHGEVKTKPKTKTRKPEYMNKAAFTNASFLIMNIVTLALLTIMMILLKK